MTKKRAVVPVVTHYLQVTDSLERTLDRLGLDRRAAPIEDLDQYLARRATERETTTTTTAAESVEPMPEPPASG